jgi:hypothetical protein
MDHQIKTNPFPQLSINHASVGHPTCLATLRKVFRFMLAGSLLESTGDITKSIFAHRETWIS